MVHECPPPTPPLLSLLQLHELKVKIGRIIDSECTVDRLVLLAEGKNIDSVASIRPGQHVVCVVRPTLPTETIRASVLDPAGEDDEETEINALFTVENRWLVVQLEKMQIPEWVVAPLTKIRLRSLAILGVWIMMSKVASYYHLGPVFFVMTIFSLICTNLGNRRRGKFSAYSIFNPGVQRLPGQLTAEQLDQEYRRNL